MPALIVLQDSDRDTACDHTSVEVMCTREEVEQMRCAEAFVAFEIIDRREHPSNNPLRAEFRVHWEGCRPEDATWEPASMLGDCSELVRTFTINARKLQLDAAKQLRDVSRLQLLYDISDMREGELLETMRNGYNDGNIEVFQAVLARVCHGSQASSCAMRRPI